MGEAPNSYLSTRQAAALLGLSHRTLERYRVTGGGPPFLRYCNRVHYLRADLDAWALAGRRRSTSDDGGAEDGRERGSPAGCANGVGEARRGTGAFTPGSGGAGAGRRCVSRRDRWERLRATERTGAGGTPAGEPAHPGSLPGTRRRARVREGGRAGALCPRPTWTRGWGTYRRVSIPDGDESVPGRSAPGGAP